MKTCPKEAASVTETTVSEGSEYEIWETCDDEDDNIHNSCSSSSSNSTESDSDDDDKGPSIEPKTLPVPEGTYKVVCLSFLDKSATAPIASKVFDEAWRTLKPGGMLYVVDNRGIVSKVPKMRQMLSRVIQPTPKLKSHDARTKEIIEANGLDAEKAFAGNQKKVVRWMGIKPAIIQ